MNFSMISTNAGTLTLKLWHKSERNSFTYELKSKEACKRLISYLFAVDEFDANPDALASFIKEGWTIQKVYSYLPPGNPITVRYVFIASKEDSSEQYWFNGKFEALNFVGYASPKYVKVCQSGNHYFVMDKQNLSPASCRVYKLKKVNI